MIIGTTYALFPSSLALDISVCDNGTTAAYAQSLSGDDRFHDRIIRWSCTNGDPRDVRWYHDGREITAEIRERFAREERAAASDELDRLTQPYDAIGARIRVRPEMRGDRPTGRALLSIDGDERAYLPADIRARDGLSARGIEAFDEMRRRASAVVALAKATVRL